MKIHCTKILHLIQFSILLYSQIRIVKIVRDEKTGLGLSIKGGAEHNLPIMISQIFKDQAADKTGKLFVGDAIIKGTKFIRYFFSKSSLFYHLFYLRFQRGGFLFFFFLATVNGEMIVHCTHDEAVNILRNAGDLIMLTVKYYRAATPFLKKDGNYDSVTFLR